MTCTTLPSPIATIQRSVLTMLVCMAIPSSLAMASPQAGESFNEMQLEVHLREDASVSHEIVRVGDIAQVSGTSPDLARQVADIELFPSPTSTRRIQAREIAERLALRGLDPFRYRLTGAMTVLLQPTSTNEHFAVQQVDYREPVHQRWQETRFNDRVDTATTAATQRIQQLTLELLTSRVGADVHWKIDVTLDPSFRHVVADSKSALTLQGVRHPWIGSHEASLLWQTEEGFEKIPVTIEIESNTLVVTAKSPIGIGDIIQAEYLELVPLASRPTYDDLVYRMEDVVGKESTRPIRVGENVRSSIIRAPIMVHRNEQVECFAIHGGVKAKTTVKALQDGSIGSLIQVERLDRSAKFAARVTGPQQVEVFSGGTGRVNITRFGR